MEVDEATDTLTVHLDKDVVARLARFAEERNTSLEKLAESALTEFLELEDKRAARRAQFDRDTLESIEEYERTGLHVTGEEMDAWFQRVAAGEDVDPPECHV